LDSPRDTVTSRSTRFPGVAPADVKLYVHACGGTRRVRAADGTPAQGIGPAGHKAYVAEILGLVGRVGPR
jgi:hypothetical protein